MLRGLITKLSRSFSQPVVVQYETTCYPYHANGSKREHGTFNSTEFEAMCWARSFLSNNPMGAVHISKEGA